MSLGALHLSAKPASLPAVITGSVLARPVASPNGTPVGVILPPAPGPTPRRHPGIASFPAPHTQSLASPDSSAFQAPGALSSFVVFLSDTCSGPVSEPLLLPWGLFSSARAEALPKSLCCTSPSRLRLSSGSHHKPCTPALVTASPARPPPFLLHSQHPGTFVVPYVCLLFPQSGPPPIPVLTGLPLSPPRFLP